VKYLTVIEKTNTGYSAYSPDLDGCVSTGSSVVEVTANMEEAITFHLEGLKLEGYEIPEPKTTSTYIEAVV
jgi:predicted RNase H-like HicB family nuclease